MASDLIYREDAKDFVRHAYHKGLNPVEYLDDVPAADVRPVVRARWIEIDDYVLCANCGVAEHSPNRNYCHGCGADMREPNLDTTKGGNHD